MANDNRAWPGFVGLRSDVLVSKAEDCAPGSVAMWPVGGGERRARIMERRIGLVERLCNGRRRPCNGERQARPGVRGRLTMAV